MKKYLEGSVWNRWDLHIHTKGTNKNDQFTSSDFDSYCSELFRKAFENKIYVIGITDYFSIENYKKVFEFQKNINTRNEFDSESKDFISSILLLPNVELRMIPVTDKNNLINIHFLFNPEYVDKLENAFFASIDHSAGSGRKFKMNKDGMIALGKDQELSLNDMEAYKRGVNSFIVSHENIQKLLDENIELRKNSIIVVSNGEDGVSGIKKHYELFENINPGSLDALRQSIFRLSDMIFSSNPSDRKYFLGKKENAQGKIVDTPEQILRKCGSLKPCIHGSDAHDELKLFKPDNDLFCWIKAIPTFNGLKQVIYEPEDRVIIQKNNPYREYDKPHFSFVKIINCKIFSDNSEIKYESNEIPLNKNLVAIIGGRGTGKSLFLDSIARTFKKAGSNKRVNEIIISPEHFWISFNKEDDEKITFKIQEENNLDYLHIHQGEVKEIANNASKLDEEIKKLLKITDFEVSDTQLHDSDIERIISDIFEIQMFLNETDELGDYINSKDYLLKKKKEKEDLIGTVTTNKNKELISDYLNNLNKQGESTDRNGRLEIFEFDLKEFETSENIKISEFNSFISSLNFDDFESMLIPEISFERQLDSITRIKKKLSDYIEGLKLKNKEIENNFRSIGVTANILSLLSDVEKYQKEILSIELKIGELEQKKKDLDDKFVEIGNYLDTLNLNYNNYREKIRSAWKTLKESSINLNPEQKSIMEMLLKDISIDAEEHFLMNSFISKIADFLSGQKFKTTQRQTKAERIAEVFNFQNKDDFINFFKGNTNISIEGDEYNLRNIIMSNIFNKDGARDFLRECLLPKNIKNFWKIISVSKYKDKLTSKLSVGQRGTFYLCLKLATDPFGKPFIFDQPEDDLDNDFIMHELVPLFKKIKKYRQVIIVTHNANLVVNADAEQVIVANNNNESLEYKMGAIEDEEIKNHICNILEGGKDAFKKRERKYEIQKEI